MKTEIPIPDGIDEKERLEETFAFLKEGKETIEKIVRAMSAIKRNNFTIRDSTSQADAREIITIKIEPLKTTIGLTGNFSGREVDGLEPREWNTIGKFLRTTQGGRLVASLAENGRLNYLLQAN